MFHWSLMQHLFALRVVTAAAIALPIYHHRDPGVHSTLLANFQVPLQAELLLVVPYHSYLYGCKSLPDVVLSASALSDRAPHWALSRSLTKVLSSPLDLQ
jgi:hypothetical protein